MSFYQSNLDNIGPEPLTDKCIVLDLDECMARSFTTPFIEELGIFKNPQLQSLRSRVYRLRLKDVNAPRGNGAVLNIEGIRRPHLNEFLAFCFAYFKVVAVWSAGKKEYVLAAVDAIFKNIKMPHVIYTYSDLEFDTVGNYDKRLQKMIEEVPNLNKYMNLSNVYMVDDLIANFKSNPQNGILIPAYRPAATISELMADDIAFLQLMKWLSQQKIAYAADVRLLDKTQIFETPLEDYPASRGLKPQSILATPQYHTINTSYPIIVN